MRFVVLEGLRPLYYHMSTRVGQDDVLTQKMLRRVKLIDAMGSYVRHSKESKVRNKENCPV